MNELPPELQSIELEAPWAPHPGRNLTTFDHPDGHVLGIRAVFDGRVIQTWITAGALPELPKSDNAEVRAKAQTARDARLQTGRTWHVPIATARTDDLAKAVTDTIRLKLLPALENRPKRALIIPHPEPKKAPASRRGKAPSKRGTKK